MSSGWTRTPSPLGHPCRPRCPLRTARQELGFQSLLRPLLIDQRPSSPSESQVQLNPGHKRTATGDVKPVRSGPRAQIPPANGFSRHARTMSADSTGSRIAEVDSPIPMPQVAEILISVMYSFPLKSGLGCRMQLPKWKRAGRRGTEIAPLPRRSYRMSPIHRTCVRWRDRCTTALQRGRRSRPLKRFHPTVPT
jgi:hypothetical protein